jgi:hypothetical protein
MMMLMMLMMVLCCVGDDAASENTSSSSKSSWGSSATSGQTIAIDLGGHWQTALDKELLTAALTLTSSFALGKSLDLDNLPCH